MNRYKIYELSGGAAQGAVDLLLAYRMAAHAQRSGDKAGLQAAFNNLQDKKQQVYKTLGMDTGHIIVQQQQEALPRAYEDYPALFMVLSKLPQFLMHCPVDYKGNHFVPPGGVPCDEKDFANGGMGNVLYKGHGVSQSPLALPRKGCALPADFDAQKHIVYEQPGIQPQYCYAVTGEALQKARQILDVEKTRSEKWKTLSQAIKAWTEDNMPGTVPSIMLRLENGKTELELRFGDEKDGKGRELNHPDWIIKRQVEYDYTDPGTKKTERVKTDRYIVSPNTATPAGRNLDRALTAYEKAVCDPVQNSLDLTSGDKTSTPRLYEMGGTIFAAYWYTHAPTKLPVQGMKPVKLSTFLWMRADEEDHGMGITPPPMPQIIKDALRKLPPSSQQGPQTPRP